MGTALDRGKVTACSEIPLGTTRSVVAAGFHEAPIRSTKNRCSPGRGAPTRVLVASSTSAAAKGTSLGGSPCSAPTCWASTPRLRRSERPTTAGDRPASPGPGPSSSPVRTGLSTQWSSARARTRRPVRASPARSGQGPRAGGKVRPGSGPPAPPGARSGWVDDQVAAEHYWRVGPYPARRRGDRPGRSRVHLSFAHRPSAATSTPWRGGPARRGHGRAVTAHPSPSSRPEASPPRPASRGCCCCRHDESAEGPSAGHVARCADMTRGQGSSDGGPGSQPCTR